MTREYWEGLGLEVEYDEQEIRDWLATRPQYTKYVSENVCIVLARVQEPHPGRTYHASVWYRGCEAGNVWSDSLTDLLARLKGRVAEGPTDEIIDD